MLEPVITVVNPYSKNEKIQLSTRDFLVSFDPMTPEEYEKYYNECLKPLKETIKIVQERLSKLERNE